MKQYGLIGKSLTHTFSPSFFTRYFSENNIDANYESIELSDISEVSVLLKGGYSGLNVTIPYKESIIPYLEALSPEAQVIGAVNTVVFKDGKPIGYNTDAFGFQQSIKPFLTFEHERAILLGTGGSSKAVAYVLKSLGIQVNFLSRNRKGQDVYAYDQVNEAMLNACKLIVNCTPVGMFPHTEDCPLPLLEGIGPRHLVVDLIYNPDETLLLKGAKNKGAAILNGLPMLKAQAMKSWELWHQLV
jgi:shikimate dehydrogenase